jgi:alcohol dehydrogenase
MKAAQITAYGGSDVVQINPEAPKPTLSDNTLLVDVYAAGVNPIDWKIREGYMQQMVPLQFPATLGGDFSGVVTEVGKSVSQFKAGDEVYGSAIIVGGGSGSFAEVAAAKAESTAHKPKTVGHLETAALPLTGVSALQALTEHIQLTSGQKILIHGGAGGIGSMAVQLAKHLGAYVAATAKGTDAEYVRQLGADEVIDYEQQSFTDLLRDYDAVFDTIGGDTYTNSFPVLKKGGSIVSMVAPADEELMKKYGVRSITQSTQVTAERLTKLAELGDQKVLTVTIDKTFPLDQAGEALEYLKTVHSRGKVVVTIK